MILTRCRIGYRASSRLPMLPFWILRMASGDRSTGSAEWKILACSSWSERESDYYSQEGGYRALLTRSKLT
jgi:hypothetical protein